MYQTIAGRCTEIINGVSSRQFHTLAHNTTYVFGSEVFDAIVINAAIDVDEVFYVIVKEGCFDARLITVGNESAK